MDDLISRAALLDAIDHERKVLIEQERFGAEHVVVHHARRIIEEFPAVNAAPVVHARWIEVDEGDGDYTYDCSVCGGKWWLAADTPEANGMKYCPYCGARMDGERRDEDAADRR